MIDRLLASLGVGCILLGGVIVAELTAGDGGASDGPAVAHPVDRSAAPRPQAPRDEELLATILARPLFSPNRKPPADEVAGQPAGPDLNDVRLTGIVVAADRRLAIFALPGAKALVRGEGETVNDWRLDTITPHQVVLSGPAGTRTLQPKIDASVVRRAPGPPRPSQNAAPMPRPAAVPGAPPAAPPVAAPPRAAASRAGAPALAPTMAPLLPRTERGRE
jgi:general secretion pathway protein N